MFVIRNLLGSAPVSAGELGIYPRHTPLIARIRPGAVRIEAPGQAEDKFVLIADGILEVQPETVTAQAELAVAIAQLAAIPKLPQKR